MGNTCPWFKKEPKQSGQSTTETIVPKRNGDVPIHVDNDNDTRSEMVHANNATPKEQQLVRASVNSTAKVQSMASKEEEGLQLNRSTSSQIDGQSGLYPGSKISIGTASSVTSRLLISDREADFTDLPRKPSSQKTIQNIVNSIKPGGEREDWKLVFQPQFSTFHKVDEHIFLTGMWGINKENLNKHDIKLIINATLDWPCYSPYDYVRITVSVLILSSN